MTRNQAKWASQHDWYRYTFEDIDRAADDAMVVCVLETGTQRQPDGTVTEYSESHTFTDYQALRAWAGY